MKQTNDPKNIAYPSRFIVVCLQRRCGLFNILRVDWGISNPGIVLVFYDYKKHLVSLVSYFTQVYK